MPRKEKTSQVSPSDSAAFNKKAPYASSSVRRKDIQMHHGPRPVTWKNLLLCSMHCDDDLMSGGANRTPRRHSNSEEEEEEEEEV